MRLDLTQKPFYLSAEQVKWVEDTIASMTEDEKVEQLKAEIRRLREEQEGGAQNETKE